MSENNADAFEGIELSDEELDEVVAASLIRCAFYLRKGVI